MQYDLGGQRLKERIQHYYYQSSMMGLRRKSHSSQLAKFSYLMCNDDCRHMEKIVIIAGQIMYILCKFIIIIMVLNTPGLVLTVCTTRYDILYFTGASDLKTSGAIK